MLESWKSRKMKDYTQRLPLSCGGTAAVFALYGLHEVVPEKIIKSALIRENVPASVIARIINEAQKPGITAKAYLVGQRIMICNNQMRPISFLHDLTPEIVPEGLQDILDANSARCLIISCNTRMGYHWQTCYIPFSLNRLVWYNAYRQWTPAVDNASARASTGLILVKGPKIQQ